MDDQRICLRTEDLTWREVDGELIVLDLRHSRYLAVNATGTALWDRLIEGATVFELTETLAERWAVDQPLLRADVDGFVRWLGDVDLLAA